jgi:3-methylfumaryl-CoA hydratase
LLGLLATLDKLQGTAELTEILPPTAHWNYFVPLVAQSQLKEDGHPRLGEFLPPIELPRRMWAGSKITYHSSITVGDRLTKNSVIEDIVEKTGSTGTLLFVTIGNSYLRNNDIVLKEEQSLVYREHPTKGEPAPARKKVTDKVTRQLVFDTTTRLLFRYSALTFNTHRIHYDSVYATDVEGYPGLIVHGQLLATMMIEALANGNDDLCVKKFTFQGRSAAIVGERLTACVREVGAGKADVWVEDSERGLIMTGSVEY